MSKQTREFQDYSLDYQRRKKSLFKKINNLTLDDDEILIMVSCK